MRLVQVTQPDLFNAREMATARDIIGQYRAVIQTYEEQQSIGITPMVLMGLAAKKITWQSNIQLDLDQVRRFMTIYSYNHTVAIPEIYVLLDDQTKKAFMLISLFT